ncbi:GH24363 [Drosophila grimshawi]|uniref:GH24363 n=1 Tax=Drosophila grimshawi TaxID=7222 RepID=B4JMB1_DROGR|nr:GH24363 [Drosophila grimshawi]
MASEADKNAPAGEAQPDNILIEQPIEISSDSDSDDSGSVRAESSSESNVNIVNSLSDSDSDLQSQEEDTLEDDFAVQLAMPGKNYKQFMELCVTAFELNVFEKIEMAITEFDQHFVIPPHIWLKYLKALKVVTQTPAECAVFHSKCARALSSRYDEPLAEFVVKSLLEEQLVEQHLMWAKVLADYGLERVDFIKDLREALGLLSDQEEIELVEKTMCAQCVTWNCNEEQLDSIEQLIVDFKNRLYCSSTALMLDSYICKANTLRISTKIKLTLGKYFYERGLAKYPTNSNLWLDYIAYMSKPLEFNDKEEIHSAINDGYLSSKPLQLIERALRTKPTIEINHKYLQLMEHYDFSLDRIDKNLNRLFERINQFIKMTVELHLDYLAYRVRQTNVDDKEQVDQLRVAFRVVWNRLSIQYGDQADTSYEVLQLWAAVEYAKLKSPSNGAAIWSEILNYPGSDVKSHLWLAYAQMESEFNGGHNTSAILQQALLSLSRPSNLDAVLELYRCKERCFGTFETIAKCQLYGVPYTCMDSKFSAPWQHRAQTPYQKPGKKPTQQAANREIVPTTKKEKKQKKPPPPTPAATTATSNESKESNFKYSSSLEPNKIFIKNLYPRCTTMDLTAVFAAFGSIQDVRLVRKPNRKAKLIAYIEYDNPEAAQEAVISGDGVNIGGLNIEVSISNPPPKNFPSTSTSAAAASGSSKSLGAASTTRPEKRGSQTTLIPTQLLMQDAKRRKKLELDDDTGTNSTDGGDANGTKCGGDAANGKESVANKDTEAGKETEQPAVAPKSNDDFRRLFNI